MSASNLTNDYYSQQHYKTMVGTVTDILNRYKGVLECEERGVIHRALLKVEKISAKPEFNPEGLDESINYFVGIGTIIKCLCHKFNETGDDRCGWYVAEVLAIGLNLIDPKLLSGLCTTMVNRAGSISQIDKRQGIITTLDQCDLPQDVLFLASKLYIGGKRVHVKQALSNVIAINDKVYFDAVPIDLEENENRFAWFATVAWKHTKPNIDYEAPVCEDDPVLSEIKTITKNPKSQFMRGKGQILKIVSHAYGIALGLVNNQGNHWQSILFHRSCVSLFKCNLGNHDLSAVFKKGDRIRFVAAAAPSSFNTQWVASYIGIDVIGVAKIFVNSSTCVDDTNTGEDNHKSQENLFPDKCTS